MKEQGIHIDQLPEYRSSFLIVGFNGWGNALDLSISMASYLIRKLNAKHFASINAELFYRYDENRPIVNIDRGKLKDFLPPSGSFHFAQTGLEDKVGITVLKACEPNLRWFQFVDEVLDLCGKLGIKTIINVGSMFDDVLHSDNIISCIASDDEMLSRLKEKKVSPITYSGPGGIHSTLHAEGEKRGFQCVSLWCHCPYYLQGTTHFGMMAQLGALLSYLAEFDLDIEELEDGWKKLKKQIQKLIEENPELNAMINGLRRAKVRGSWTTMRDAGRKIGKIIQIKDFLDSR